MDRRRRSRLVWAAVVLLVVFLGFFALVGAILAFEPGDLPLRVYLPGMVVTVAFAAALVASRRFDAVWRRGFLSTVAVPGWLWLAALLVAVLASAASFLGPVPTRGALYLAVGAIGASYALAIASDRGRLRRHAPWPTWIALAMAAMLLAVVGVSVVAAGNTPINLVFLLALLLFTFHVWFILPLTLYDAVSPPATIDGAYPAVDVLIPAYNEAGVVGDCVEAVLALEYPREQLEVVVIDDGSTDATAAEAAAYRDRGVRVLSRRNGGKHAALNFGLECTDSPVVVTVDADSRPAPAALERMVAQLVADETIGALSATVLALNDGPAIGGLQRLEYAVSNANRRAYSVFDAVPVVPGCFGVYRREALEAVWGYDPDTVTEDFDVTIKLLRAGWAVRHGAALTWTIVPAGWRALWRQRLRWYRGGLETLAKHRAVLSTPGYGYLHAVTLPARAVSQLFTPVASFAILAAIAWGLATGPDAYLLVLLGLFFVLTLLIGLFSVLVEDEPLWTVVYAPLLFVGYKHFVDASVGVGSLMALAGRGGDWADERPHRPTTTATPERVD